MDLESRHWLALQLTTDRDLKWHQLEHQGVLFPAPYVPVRVPLRHKGKDLVLNPAAEEAARLYAKHQGGTHDTPTFRRNFWRDWKPLLVGTGVERLEDCDFGALREAGYPQVDKEALAEIEELMGVAAVDGQPEAIANYRAEPPGLFLGRGAHPLAGSIKPRLTPADVTLNLGEDAPIPEPRYVPLLEPAPTKGGDIDGGGALAWGAIVHSHQSEWLASWPDRITGKTKYVWLAAGSSFKSSSDLSKFDLARKLKRKLKSIRAAYETDLTSSDAKARQLAAALYLIDRLALRVGNEKGDDSSDTVGVTSLRVEHVKLGSGALTVELDFLGKDSIRYHNTVEVPQAVFDALSGFAGGKDPKDQLFDLIDSGTINAYLQALMPELTAKVFRTCQASSLFQKRLAGITDAAGAIAAFNQANAEVARLCNHTKTATKASAEADRKLDERIAKETNAKKKAALRLKKRERAALKGLALGTSKINYIDPRISVAYMKRHGVPLAKLFSPTLQKKFAWALDTPADYTF